MKYALERNNKGKLFSVQNKSPESVSKTRSQTSTDSKRRTRSQTSTDSKGQSKVETRSRKGATKGVKLSAILEVEQDSKKEGGNKRRKK